MPDVSLEWGGDFVVSASGGLLLADRDDLARQRIERRLFTAVRGYLWHQDYGVGIPQKIGRTVNVNTLTALVRSQIALEAAVAPYPVPIISVTEDANNLNLYTISISYTSATNGSPVTLSISTS